MSSPDESLPNKVPSSDPDATTYRPSSDPDATEYHVSSGASSPSSGFTPGSRLNDNFRLERQLGRGGMGEAWKAFDETANRFVVLKFIPKEIQHVKEAVDAVRDSFAKVHELQHQHICPVYGLFTDPHHGLYLVMKFIDGLPLDEYKRKFIEKHGKISFSDTVQILWGIAKGLDYAHDKRVIHRDIKPQNVMISKKDGVQIIDFGLAEEIRTSMVRFSEVTMDIAGTRPYMAPEQWQGRLQDARTDQYALAVTAYELFAGHAPFYGNDIGILRECVLHDPPESISELPDHVNAALLKALAKKREDRFENCKAFVKAMAEKPKAETKAPDLIPAQAGPEVSVVPSLRSDPIAGATAPPIWVPSVSSTKPTPEPPRRRTRQEHFVWIAAIVGLGLVALFPFFLLNASKAKPSPTAVTKSPTVKKSETPSKPVKAKSEPDIVTAADAANPGTAASTPPSPALLEKPTPYDVADLVVNKLHGIVQLKLADGKYESYIATRKDLLKEVPGTVEPLPRNFERIVEIDLSSFEKTWTIDGWRLSDDEKFPCQISGFKHHSAPCRCALTPEEVRILASVKDIPRMKLGERIWTLDDWGVLFKDLKVEMLDISNTPPMPHWKPLESLASVDKLLARYNVIGPTHMESILKAKNLHWLNLSGSQLSPGTLKPLEGNASLLGIELSGCVGLTTEDFVSLSTMKRLDQIWLVETVMTDDQLMILAGVEKLTRILLKNNGITAGGLEAFKKKRPDVVVELKGQTAFPVRSEEIPETTSELFLGDLLWKSAKTAFGGPGPKLVPWFEKNKPLSFWAPPPSNISYELGKRWKTFECKIGIQAFWTPAYPQRFVFMPGGDKPSAKFIVKGDGKILYESPVLRDGREIPISVDVSGVDLLELITDDAGDGGRFDACKWKNPMLKRTAKTHEPE